MPLGLVVGCDHLHEGYEGVEGEQDESRLTATLWRRNFHHISCQDEGRQKLSSRRHGLGLTGIEWRGIDVMAAWR